MSVLSRKNLSYWQIFNPLEKFHILVTIVIIIYDRVKNVCSWNLVKLRVDIKVLKIICFGFYIIHGKFILLVMNSIKFNYLLRPKHLKHRKH